MNGKVLTTSKNFSEHPKKAGVAGMGSVVCPGCSYAYAGSGFPSAVTAPVNEYV